MDATGGGGFWRKSARARLFAALATLGFLVAAGGALRLLLAAKPAVIRISAGHTGSTETLRRMSLVGDVPGGGLRAVSVITEGSVEMLEHVDRGALDFAFVQGGFDMDRYANVRQVVGLDVVPLTLLVRAELHEAVVADLGALRNRSVNLGSGVRTGTYWLSRELLEFAGLGPDDFRASALTVDQLRGESDPKTRPDAVFLVASPPSPLVRHFIGRLGYRIVPLPYGPAFRAQAQAQALGRASGPAGGGLGVCKEHIADALIPAFAYGVSPPVPPRDVATVGSRLLLVTHRDTRPEVVIRVLEALFASRWAKAVQPPLDAGSLNLPPEIALHPGAVQFRDRDRPLVTADSLSILSNGLQIALPIGGGLLFLWGWLKNRISAGRERHFDRFLALVGEVERQGSALERGGTLDDEALHRLNRELSVIRETALGDLATRETSAESFAALLLAHIADVRASLADLRRGAPFPGDGPPPQPVVEGSRPTTPN